MTDRFNALSLSHRFLAEHVRPGDLCIDATAGRGYDTAYLAGLTGETGRVLAFDIHAPLAEIGDALNDSLLHSYDFFDSMIQNATTAIGPAPYSTNITVFRQKKARIVRKITPNSADS